MFPNNTVGKRTIRIKINKRQNDSSTRENDTIKQKMYHEKVLNPRNSNDWYENYGYRMDTSGSIQLTFTDVIKYRPMIITKTLTKTYVPSSSYL